MIRHRSELFLSKSWFDVKLLPLLVHISGSPLNKKRRIKSVLTFFIWQVRSRIYKTDHEHSWIAGSRFYVRLGETSLTGNIYRGLMEYEHMSFLLHFLRAEDNFVDVGANSGSYTILSSKVVGANTVSFEPLPETHARLISNVQLNAIESKVVAKNMAVGESEGRISFTQNLDSMNHITSASEADGEFIEVEISTLDSEIVETPALIKIDVEGFESAVLSGAKNLLNNENLKAIIIELNGSGARYGYSDQSISNTLKSLEFCPISYNPVTRDIEPLPGPHNLSGNTIFIRDSDFVQKRLREAEKFSINSLKI